MDLFKDNQRNSELIREGYTVFDFLAASEVSELADFYHQKRPEGALQGFHASMFHEQINYREQMDQKIREVVGRVLAPELEDGFELLYANYMVKEVGEDSEMKMHQDWTYVNEDRAKSYAIWIPLLDLNETNGIFTVLPNSHHTINHFRGPGLQCPFDHHWQDMDRSLWRPIPLKAGQAIVWDHRLAHCSPPNLSDKSRIAVTAIIVPKSEQVVHYFRPSMEDKVERYAVDRDFYMNYAIGKRPQAELIDYVEHETEILSKEKLEAMAAGNYQETKSLKHEDFIMRRPPRRVFRSEELENEFQREGFVTMDLLNESKFKELQQLLHELLHSTDKENVNIQSEYELSFFNKDMEYRKKVLTRVYEFFKPMIDKILDGYEPLIVNLFNKKPGGGEIPIHQNWTFVDEDEFTSVSVWIPLCPVSRLNGTLEVVPKTHNTLTNYRSPSIPWVFKGLEEVLKEKYLQPLELVPGQIGILDDAILHWSSDNDSQADRSTIQIIMKPKEAKALHYYCEDLNKGDLTVYEVDSDFFAGFEMNSRPEGVPVMGKTTFKYEAIDEAGLINRIS